MLTDDDKRLTSDDDYDDDYVYGYYAVTMAALVMVTVRPGLCFLMMTRD